MTAKNITGMGMNGLLIVLFLASLCGGISVAAAEEENHYVYSSEQSLSLGHIQGLQELTPENEVVRSGFELILDDPNALQGNDDNMNRTLDEISDYALQFGLVGIAECDRASMASIIGDRSVMNILVYSDMLPAHDVLYLSGSSYPIEWHVSEGYYVTLIEEDGTLKVVVGIIDPLLMKETYGADSAADTARNYGLNYGLITDGDSANQIIEAAEDVIERQNYRESILISPEEKAVNVFEQPVDPAAADQDVCDQIRKASQVRLESISSAPLMYVAA